LELELKYWGVERSISYEMLNGVDFEKMSFVQLWGQRGGIRIVGRTSTLYDNLTFRYLERIHLTQPLTIT
jgi:hypothetical protein